MRTIARASMAGALMIGVLQPMDAGSHTHGEVPRSDATSAPPANVSGLDTVLDPGWLMVQCYCWRGEGVSLPAINMREERGDWSYTWTPDLGQPTIFTDLPTDVGLIVELADKDGINQARRADGMISTWPSAGS